ncbi:Spy/CpxP family protein refolding chaperone [Flavihalobacter algicola]|uniref:Spy/CpxP family protein refolding chaperone n=3 Tax=Psychroserpens algicola TaxID=1719034 RepID=A0ABT0H8V7_9FLAO|nr:Spy/CpxP family protein refolding chaperone [Psychroserpens algicola]
MKNMSAEDQATIATKKLTLALDLTEKQQSQVKELMLEQAIHRKEKMAERAKMKSDTENDTKLKVEKTDEQKIKAVNERLDRQIETKQKMKAILTSEQYEKWEKTQGRRHGKAKSKRKMKGDH